MQGDTVPFAGGGLGNCVFVTDLLCTRGVTYALFISLLISKLFCRKGCMAGGGGGGRVS